METLAGTRHPALLGYRGEFPLLERVRYLNTCSLGALSTASRRRLDGYLGEWDELGARAWYGRWLPALDELRAGFGWAIGRPQEEITLAPNVSVALASVASALDPVHRNDGDAVGRLRETGLGVGTQGRARTRVITTELDFPTVGHQWLARAPLGVELVVLPSPDGLAVPLESFAEAIDDRTALVATGHVYFTTGAVQDLAGLTEIAHTAGALVLTDAYQATGLLPTDAAALGVDFYVSGTLKWLFGGPGTAFLWVRPDIAAALTPTTTGWFSSARQFAFDVASLDLAEGGRKFELGTPSLPSAFVALGGLEMVREIGIDRIHERTLDLGDLAIERAAAAGLRVRAIRGPGARGGIVTIEARDPMSIVDALAEQRIIVDYRPGIVRLSPAFYNTDQEVEEAIDAIASLVPEEERVA